jgi:hypothetical protein
VIEVPRLDPLLEFVAFEPKTRVVSFDLVGLKRFFIDALSSFKLLLADLAEVVLRFENA